MSFNSKVRELIDNAPTAQRANVNYGPTTFTPIVVRWTDTAEGRKPIKTPLHEYLSKHGYKDDNWELEKGESLQLRVVMDLEDINPKLDFPYEREVAILASTTRVKTDWAEILLPSLEKVFGKSWHEKILANGKKAAPIFYLAVEQADPVNPPKEGKKAYSVPKVLEIFPDRDACIEARNARYGDPAEAEKFGPEDEDEDEADTGAFSQEDLDSAWSIFTSTQKNRPRALKMIGKAYSQYNAEELLNAAIAANEGDEDEDE